MITLVHSVHGSIVPHHALCLDCNYVCLFNNKCIILLYIYWQIVFFSLMTLNTSRQAATLLQCKAETRIWLHAVLLLQCVIAQVREDRSEYAIPTHIQ